MGLGRGADDVDAVVLLPVEPDVLPLEGFGENAKAAPLFVRPIHMIGDFGKMGKSGLHLKKSHLQTRTSCLNQMNTAFYAATDAPAISAASIALQRNAAPF